MRSIFIRNLSQALTMTRGLSPVKNAAILVDHEIIKAVGPEDEIRHLVPQGAEVIDAGGRCAMPGLVDPHTHLVYAGNRALEFAQRLSGADYLEILRAGGGILSTVRATRAASDEELYLVAEERLCEMLSWGVTTVEIKSGYGLSVEHELRSLRVAKRLSEEGFQIVPTFLGAHAVPPEFKDNRKAYVDLVVNEMLPAAKEFAAFCDVFMDEGAFSRDETERIFGMASDLGYKLKIHADELAPTGGAEMAGKWRAVSADHLLHPSDEGLRAMAEAGTVAVMLPATSFTLRKPYAPVQRFREHGLRIALATDHNPGTSPTLSLILAATIGVLAGGLTIEEALLGITVNAALALGLEDRGTLAPGKRADLLILDADDPVHMFYHLGRKLTYRVFVGGKEVYSAK
ncbi:MAG: imidazolonepropionase [candidate division WOR-3 bacterium]